MNNLLEKEGEKLAAIDKTEPYWKLIIKTYSDLMMHPSIAKETIPSVCKGLVEIIFGRKWSAFGEGLADNEVDFAEIPAEYHEQDASFDWQTF